MNLIFCLISTAIFRFSFQGGSPADRNASDKAALEAKVAKKEATKKQEEANAAQAVKNKTVTRKKVPKKADAGLDDLLSAGLKKK